MSEIVIIYPESEKIIMKSKKIAATLTALVLLIPSLVSCGGDAAETSSLPESTAPLTEPVTTGTETDPVTEPETTEEPEEIKRIYINELMADNEDFYLGCMDDWAELYNDEDEDVTLDSFYLRRGSEDDEKLPLDGMTVPAKGYLVIKLDEESPFRLPKEGGMLVLRYKKETVDFMEYDGTVGTSSWSHDGKCDTPTPGFPNTVSGAEEYRGTLVLPGLYISEVMTSNKKYAPYEGKYYDILELCNNGDATVRLSGFYLSDKRSDPKRYKLPDTELPAGGYCVIYCSGLDAEGHAPFKISSDGEELFLSDGNGLIDYMRVPGDVKQNESYGRNGTSLVYMDKPTPGKENAEGYTAALAAPTASLPSGSYDHTVVVSLSGEGQIYYTLDGTEPDANSTLYEAPIGVDGIVSVRAVCKSGGRTSALSSFFYLVGVEHVHPVVNVAIKEEYLTGEQGVLVNIKKEYEHEAYVTMMDGGVELFSAPCGFKLHGNDSKEGAKQNFQLRFRSKYGLGTLDYPLFEDRDYTKFNSLILHGGSEDYKFAGLRDELCTRLVDGTTALNVQACRPVVFYLNGEYRGIYWIRERIDAQYCANRLGVSKDSINLLHTYGTVSDGDNESYLALLKFCEKNDLRNEDNYKYVMDKIDAESLMDWYICRAYFADMDLANVKFYQSTEDDGKWHWCFFDLDWSFYHNRLDTIKRVMPNNGCHTMIRALLRNPDFEDRFIRRCAYILQNVLTEERVLGTLQLFMDQMEPELEANHKKYRLSLKTRENHINMIKDFVRDGLRQRNMMTGIKDYFGLDDGQMEKYFGSAQP